MTKIQSVYVVGIYEWVQFDAAQNQNPDLADLNASTECHSDLNFSPEPETPLQ